MQTKKELEYEKKIISFELKKAEKEKRDLEVYRRMLQSVEEDLKKVG